MLLTILPYIQITVAVLLIIAILLQKRGSGLGAAFGGGGGGGGSYATRRGLECILFYITIVLSTIFILIGLLTLLLK